MKIKDFNRIIYALDSATCINDIKNVINPFSEIFEYNGVRNNIQRNKILRKIAEVTSNFGEDLTHSYEDLLGEQYILGITFGGDGSPTVWTGYAGFNKSENKYVEYLNYKSINSKDDETKEYKIGEYNGDEDIKKEPFISATEILYDELKKQYQEKKNIQKKKL